MYRLDEPFARLLNFLPLVEPDLHDDLGGTLLLPTEIVERIQVIQQRVER